jgi:predicted transcriptional regulator
MNRRRGIWLALAVVLLALGAVLMFTGQGDEPAAQPREVDFPRRMRREDWKRAEQRRTQVVQAPAVVDAGVAATPQRPRDPVLASLPRGKGRSAVVIEANALRYSPIGELLLDCMMRDGGKKLEEFRKASGVDPLQDLDRLVITDKGLIISGNFGRARFAELLKDRVSSDYGASARVYEQTDNIVQMKDGTTRKVGSRPAIGTWNDQLLVVGDDSDAVKEVISQVEGGGSNELPVINEGSTYGEMYGVLSVDQLVRMLPPDQTELGQRLKEVAEHVELHMDASSDVAVVADIHGADPAQVTDLGKSVGAALSVARLKAQADGNKDLAQLLDFAKVHPGGSGFEMELAVPLDVLKERLAFCRDERRAAEAKESSQAPEPQP